MSILRILISTTIGSAVLLSLNDTTSILNLIFWLSWRKSVIFLTKFPLVLISLTCDPFNLIWSLVSSSNVLIFKFIVRKGEVIKSSIFGIGDLNRKSINLKIQSLLRETRDEIKSKGSQANEIKTSGNFVKKITDFLKENQNIKFKLEVVSLRDSKTAEPIVVEINILKIVP